MKFISSLVVLCLLVGCSKEAAKGAPSSPPVQKSEVTPSVPPVMPAPVYTPATPVASVPVLPPVTETQTISLPPAQVLPPVKTMPVVSQRLELGITNAGNSCYFNALISVLSSFRDFLPKNLRQTAYDQELSKILDELEQGKDTVADHLRASHLFYDGAQDDPYSAVLGKISLNHNIFVERTILRNYAEEHPEYGQAASDIESTKIEKLPILEFEMQSGDGQIFSTIDQSIHNFFDEEKLPHPNEKKYPTYYQKISRSIVLFTPKYVMIRLKRFSMDGIDGAGNILYKKLSQKYIVSQMIELPYAYSESSKTLQYKLVATVNHEGSLNSGHYYSYIFHENINGWKKHNDKQVTKVLSDDMVYSNSDSYLLLFMHNDE